ncbi:MAG TPA: hypothetical protein VK186_13520 [Candidatus Deferrimicrobium sp.]|nr:hypothetical protein [Candidatus Kapabacteria bacterium]HLP59853.1 hypothetical protein [Candidatus Deferrimicrobium sp.]
MIKIKKSTNPPQILIQSGQDETEKNKRLFEADPTSYQNRDKNFEIKSSIFGQKTVKVQLITDQFKKCCYCEANFTVNSFGDIEHFRPKGGYVKKGENKITYPGYYWKAYDWDNLFFSCQVCNTRSKKNYFPLEDESKRAKSHHDNIDNESPLLVHPSQDDPELHIGFREEVCYPKDNSEKGKESIVAYGLNRDELLETRREYLNSMRHNYLFSGLEIESMVPGEKAFILKSFNISEEELIELIEEARCIVKKAHRVDSPFASMIRHNFPIYSLPQ